LDHIGIVMPAYNAEKSVCKTVERLPLEWIERSGCAPTLFVVNDGSTDGTAEVVARLAGRHSVLPVVSLGHERNRGYGAALKTGLAASVGSGNDFHVVLHSDGQYAPEEVPEMVGQLRGGLADAVVGSKFLKGGVLRQGMPLLRALGIRVLDRMENLAFGLRGLEFHSGYTAWTTAALERIDFQSLTDGFHFDGEMVLSAAKSGLVVRLVPISTRYGAGTSSLNPWPYLGEVVRTVVRYRRGRYWFQSRRGASRS